MTSAALTLGWFDAPALVTTFSARSRLRKVLALALLATLTMVLVGCPGIMAVIGLVGQAINLLNSAGVFGDGAFARFMGMVGMACSVVGMVGSLYSAGVQAVDLMAQPEGACLLGSAEAGSGAMDYAFAADTGADACAAPWAASSEAGIDTGVATAYPVADPGPIEVRPLLDLPVDAGAATPLDGYGMSSATGNPFTVSDGNLNSANWELGAYDAGGTEVVAGTEAGGEVATAYPVADPGPIEERALPEPVRPETTRTSTRSTGTRIRAVSPSPDTGGAATSGVDTGRIEPATSVAAPRTVSPQPATPMNVSGELPTQQYIDRYMQLAGNDPDAAWNLAYEDRAQEGFQNLARRDAEHYLWSRQDVQSNSYQWAPSMVRTAEYSAVKVPWHYGVKAINAVRGVFGAVPIANTTKPTMSEFLWGIRGSNDALFGSGN